MSEDPPVLSVASLSPYANATRIRMPPRIRKIGKSSVMQLKCHSPADDGPMDGTGCVTMDLAAGGTKNPVSARNNTDGATMNPIEATLPPDPW